MITLFGSIELHRLLSPRNLAAVMVKNYLCVQAAQEVDKSRFTFTGEPVKSTRSCYPFTQQPKASI